MVLLIGSLLVGATLALYFRVLVLAPVSLVGWVYIAQIGVTDGYSTGLILLECVLVVVCMPLGYLVGALIPHARDVKAPYGPKTGRSPR